MLLQQRHQLAGVETWAPGDFDRSDILPVVGRQDRLAIGSRPRLLTRIFRILRPNPNTQSKQEQPSKSAGTSRDTKLFHQQLDSWHPLMGCTDAMARFDPCLVRNYHGVQI